MEESNQPNTQKVQLVLAKGMLANVERLKKRIGATSRADTFRYAVDLVLQIADEIDKGTDICFENDEGIRRLLIPFLSRTVHSPQSDNSEIEE